ncbi:DUF5686 and carboxypeptidase regulatory-like domain-containing protein [Flavobacteriales bacterium]|jgi:hypothetical protein|nr:DUF5686 and carboxypeptidase regulatory-like domain-containing protein [Flavobacteriales bacterium]
MKVISTFYTTVYFLTIYILFPLINFCNHISGVISDSNGEPLPFASIYIKNSTYGVSSNAFGEYFIELEDGQYTIVYSYIGFQNFEKTIKLKDHSQKIDIQLLAEDQNLIEYEVVSNTRNKALEIINEVKKNKKKFIHRSNSSIEYLKNTIEKRQYKLKRKDTIEIWQLDTSEQINFKNDVLKFIESYGRLYRINQNNNFRDYKAYHDFADTKEEQDFVLIQSFEDFGEYNITPKYEANDDYEILNNLSEIEFNLFLNNINVSISNKPIISPLAPGSRTYYKYDYLGFIPTEDSNKIFKIKITPRFNNEPLLKGILFVKDSSFNIESFELKLSGPIQSEFKIENFHVIQNYQQLGNQNLLKRKIIDYSIKEDIHKILGNTVAIYDDFKFKEKVPEYFKKNQIKYFADSSFSKNNEQWNEFRPLDLKENEIEYVRYTDSLRQYYQSEEYALKQDSGYNEITWAKLLWEGIGRKNRYKGYSFYVWPVISQFNILGVGGYRHNLGFNYNQNISDQYKISTQNRIDYGVANKDFKGSTNISIISNKKKYKQLTLAIGDEYKVINRFPSIITAFSRSNYVRSQQLETAYRTEILNGLYSEWKISYCFQTPIDNLDLSTDWFSPLDSAASLAPVRFNPYTKLESRIQITWLPFQKYYYKKNKKIVLGTKFPTVNIIYRKGVPKLFQSEVNFDYLEVGVNDEFSVPHLGKSKWNVQLGSFLNKENLRVIEWKYFRGSDRGFFSNPLTSLQLLGPTLLTQNSFFRANYVHSFDGNILNKIPIINRLGLQLSGGAASLIIPDVGYQHLEVFLGISRPFKIFGGLVKFGVFIASSINSENGLESEFKLGANGYNSMRDQWDY